MNNPIITLEGVEKRFGNNHVVKNMNLEIAEGEFLTLLGPSGCGKTTTLRMIAGFEEASSGIIKVEGERIEDKEPFQRNVNTVFQNYALFPHMTVAANVGYGLRLQKKDKADIRTRVEKLLELVQLEGYGKRMPAELSGGQKQRVAIARALAVQPKVLLLDEPLGALDLQLRRQMQFELKRLPQPLGRTFIYITHDQEDALNMSSRIAVMRDGRFEQIGTPAEVYDHPRTAYVARFVGTANILRGTVKRSGPVTCIETPAGCACAAAQGTPPAAGSTASLAVRSEQVQFSTDLSADGMDGVIREKNFAGGMLRIVLELAGGQQLVASRHGIDLPAQPGQQVKITWQPDHAVLVQDEEAGA